MERRYYVITQAAPPTDLQGRSELQLCHVDHVSEEGPLLPCVQKGVQAADVPAKTVLGNITVMQRVCVFKIQDDFISSSEKLKRG